MKNFNEMVKDKDLFDGDMKTYWGNHMSYIATQLNQCKVSEVQGLIELLSKCSNEYNELVLLDMFGCK